MTRSATCGLKLAGPSEVTTSSAVPSSSAMFLSIDAFADAAITSRPLIRATEIISADAVAEVRRGLRSALRRPSVTGALRPNGHIRPRTAYRLISGLTMTTPSTVIAAPNADQDGAGEAAGVQPDQVQRHGHQQHEPADDDADQQRALRQRRRRRASRRPAGACRARRAAGYAAAIVTPMPTR